MAMGALARLRAGGLAVPADIALAGFDDIGTLRDVYPPLTTVRLPLKRMGEMAAGLVLAEPPGPAPPGPEPRRVVPVPGEVILRDSTLPHPPARRQLSNTNFSSPGSHTTTRPSPDRHVSGAAARTRAIPRSPWPHAVPAQALARPALIRYVSHKLESACQRW